MRRAGGGAILVPIRAVLVASAAKIQVSGEAAARMAVYSPKTGSTLALSHHDRRASRIRNGDERAWLREMTRLSQQIVMSSMFWA
jgi:hypothetical protein